MNSLNLFRINQFSPYEVELVDDEYLFETDHNIQYAVSFDLETISDSIIAYWFNLANRSGISSPNDKKIRTTIVLILEEFFRVNPDILLYMCDNADDQQAVRSRLFLRWFNAYGRQKDYFSRTEMIMDEQEENYIALIVKRTHPQLQVIIDTFDQQIAMFRANKPT